MSWRDAKGVRLAAAAVVVLAAALVLGAAPAAKRAPAGPHAIHYPAGAGRAIAERACLACHSTMLVTQQHKDRAGWEKTVHQMELWGAPVPAAAHDSLVGYLAERFGPAKR